MLFIRIIVDENRKFAEFIVCKLNKVLLKFSVCLFEKGVFVLDVLEKFFYDFEVILILLSEF